MAPRVLYVLGALLCAVVLISSQVVAREESTVAQEQKKIEDTVGDNKQVHGCARGCCGWFRQRCIKCCHRPDTVTDAPVGDNKHHLSCPRGCCKYEGDHCVLCCKYDAPVGDNKDHLSCPHGCCKKDGDHCVLCCKYGGEDARGGVEEEGEPQN